MTGLGHYGGTGVTAECPYCSTLQNVAQSPWVCIVCGEGFHLMTDGAVTDSALSDAQTPDETGTLVPKGDA